MAATTWGGVLRSCQEASGNGEDTDQAYPDVGLDDVASRRIPGSTKAVLYALDAATGTRLWQFKANGAISGSATVIDGIVYFASLIGRTYALDARTGRQVWTFPDGRYTPVVADRDRLYLIGYHRIYGMVAP